MSVPMEGKSKTANPADIQNIIDDAQMYYRQGKPPEKVGETVFAKLVIGGETALVSAILNKIQRTKNDGLFDWLTKGPNARATSLRKENDYGKKVLKCILFSFLWVFFTPIFYGLFAMISKAMNNSFRSVTKSKLSKFKKIDLPLALAVFSGNEEMIRLFLKYTSIDKIDRKGNNVVHYLADLSSAGLKHSFHCLNILRNLTNEGIITSESLQNIIRFEKNICSQTALEHATQYGRIPFAMKLIDYSMTDTGIALQKNIIIHDELQEDITETFGNNLQQRNWVEKRLDISEYMQFQNGFTSYLLSLLISRQTTQIPADDLWCMTRNACIQKWMKQKYIQWRGSIIIIVLVELLVSFLLMLIMVQGQGNMKFIPNKNSFVNYNVQVFLQKFNESLHLNNSDTNIHINYTWGLNFFEKNKYLIKNLTLDQVNMDFYELNILLQDTKKGFENMSHLYETVCNSSKDNVEVGDLVLLDKCTKKAAEFVADSCRTQMLHDYGTLQGNDSLEFAVVTSFHTKVYTDTKSNYTNFIGKTLMIQTEKQNYIILFVLFAYFLAYLLLDIYSRLFSLMQQIWQSKCKTSTIFSTPVQGSHVKAQAAILSASMFMVFFALEVELDYFYNRHHIIDEKTLNRMTLTAEFIDYNRFYKSFFRPNLIWITILVCRIILHLHHMRLIPWIGKFVITTFQMAADLFQFAVIFILTVALFACLFYAFSKDAACTTWDDNQHQQFHDSLFTTFALTYGHIDFNYSNTAIKVAYIVYVVVSVILLLNLIIAVMSSTATCITVQPWSAQLFKKSRLNEALGIEHTMITISHVVYQLLPCYWTVLLMKCSVSCYKQGCCCGNRCYKCLRECFACPCTPTEGTFYKMGRVEYESRRRNVETASPIEDVMYSDEHINLHEWSAFIYVVDLINKDDPES